MPYTVRPIRTPTAGPAHASPALAPSAASLAAARMSEIHFDPAGR
jgi:hypothetical protein